MRWAYAAYLNSETDFELKFKPFKMHQKLNQLVIFYIWIETNAVN